MKIHVPTFTEQHEKTGKRSDDTYTLSAFLDWLESEHLWIAEPFQDDEDTGGFAPTPRTKEQLIGGFIGVDVAAYHNEKEMMFKYVQWMNKFPLRLPQ